MNSFLTLFSGEQIGILGRIAAAMLLGALIGLDREAARKPAGLRTHILVAGVAALLISVGDAISESYVNHLGSEIVTANPVRIVAATITGISFLGAGTIIRDRSEGHVEGLTTAASLLFASVVGMTAALRHWTVAVGATILVLVILSLLPWVESRLDG